MRSQARIEPDPDLYTTNTLPLFVGHLGLLGRAETLDLGPLSGRNLDFLAGEMGFRVRMEDLSFSLTQKGGQAVEELELPEGRFHGVLAWSLFDYLKLEEAEVLVKKLWKALVPGGVVQAFFSQHRPSKARVQQFNILSSNQISIREVDPELPWRPWANREVLDTFAPFEAANSFILKSGLREYLFRRPGNLTWPSEPA